MKKPKYKLGQVVIFASKKDLPIRILEVIEEDGEFFYRFDRKNALHEPMLRELNESELGR